MLVVTPHLPLCGLHNSRTPDVLAHYAPAPVVPEVADILEEVVVVVGIQ